MPEFRQGSSLPALYVCENNLYGEYTRSEVVTAGTLQARAEAMNISFQSVDGSDVWAVREVVSPALESIRAGGGPAVVEANTYRFVGHSRSDAGAYRPEGELDSWRERDPLKIARERLSSAYGVDDQVLDRIESEVAAELDAVEQAAVAAPFPDPAAPASEFKA